MSQCKRCGSFAVNPRHHGREPNTDLDLCDVCYWRKRTESKDCVTRVEFWALITKEGVFTCPEATSDEYVWGYYLYRTEEDIEEAKARGDRVCRVIVEIPE